ncbi:hypothetical protein EMN47_17505 [Prolixibacteraceae bacterium JC049]|nr:hypothetical protein [Prolixibacteraceae bacterium JC049]
MKTIIDARQAVIDFLENLLNHRDISIIKLEKTDNSWHSIAEVFEDDSFLRSMNLPPKKNKLFYEVQLNKELEVERYERMDTYTP